MKDLIKKVKVFFAMRKANKEFTEAILRAEELYRTHNKRYYVIPDTKNQLRVFSWSELKLMRKQGLFSSQAKEPDFIRECFYYTPSRLDQMFMKPETKDKKRKAWLEYYKLYRM